MITKTCTLQFNKQSWIIPVDGTNVYIVSREKESSGIALWIFKNLSRNDKKNFCS